MSYIPAKKMPHVTAQSGEFDAETGKIVHLHPEETKANAAVPTRFSWIAGAAGAGLAAVVLGAFFALRSSSSRKPTRRRMRTTTKRAPARRKITAKRKNAA
ncbi:hypothetical protein FHS31_000977 [Sphingomonas vulcanisoli]|uniref:Uncharacterized protein n=1 Tax=Sphingomonas vulcanisoli TaxID=1658060 RepID=A0ABX0TPC2_9SPHN|nr:hypothetical protein [Sphingomonas vulcanisoli]NIJ07381.1 hypothetical protein [Sphingomonas vulcanisoli]